MNPLDNLPVSPPKTVHDWAAFRELHRDNLSSLDPESLAVLYGFSSLVEYRDDDCLQSIERMMDGSDDPVRARYDLAWNLGEFFDECFYVWKTIYTPDERARLDAIQAGAYGAIPNGRRVRPGEPGYVGEIPAELHTKVVGWLVEGIKRFRDDDEMFQHIRTIAARALAGDTFLDEEDIEQLRRASNDELTLRTDTWAQQRIKEFGEEFNRRFGQDEDTEE